MSPGAAAASTGSRIGRRHGARTGGGAGYVSEHRQAKLKEDFAAKTDNRLNIAKNNPDQFLVSLGLGGGWPSKDSRQLSITVTGHEEKCRCTYYQMKCELRGPNDRDRSFPSWHCEMRLCEIRDEIFDKLVEALGDEAYEVLFSEAPFALRGGLPGTTARLKDWMDAFAACFNGGHLESQFCAHCLGQIQAPVLSNSNAFCNDSGSQPQVSPAEVIVPPMQEQMAR